MRIAQHLFYKLKCSKCGLSRQSPEIWRKYYTDLVLYCTGYAVTAGWRFNAQLSDILQINFSYFAQKYMN